MWETLLGRRLGGVPGRGNALRLRGVRVYDTFEELQSTARESCRTPGVRTWGGVSISVLGKVGATEGFKWSGVCRQVGLGGQP